MVMADIYLTNTLTRKKEKFIPINSPNVGMYTCGPTVYNFMHIGNLRTFVFSDILYRVLTFNGYKVTAIQNITDIDDKIIKRAKETNSTIEEVAGKYTDLFIKDVGKLNIHLVHGNQPKATEYVDQIKAYVQELIKKDLAYVEKDGSVYFDISKFSDYGKLSGIDKRELKTGTRTLSDEYTKEDVQDFALWKSVLPDDKFGFDSPWGWGRPGWHIECSVMSQQKLGDTFDIHLGGVDLIFPHHENEIAQSEGKTGKKFVNYFVHGAHIMVDGKKMSKSLNNFFTLMDIEKKGFDPISLRYLYLTAHYRDPLNFTWESLSAAQNALENLRKVLAGLKGESRTQLSEEKNEKVEKYRADFVEAVNDDLNTPRALAVLWEMLKSNIPSNDKYDLAMTFDEVFGLGLSKTQKRQISKTPDNVKILVEEREKLRKGGKWQEADKVRQEIENKGYEVEDTESGPKVKTS